MTFELESGRGRPRTYDAEVLSVTTNLRHGTALAAPQIWIRDQEAIRRMAERQWTIGTQHAREDWTAPTVINVKKPSLTKLPMVPKQWPKLGERCPFEDCEKSFATPGSWMKHWNSTHLLEDTPKIVEELMPNKCEYCPFRFKMGTDKKKMANALP